MFGLTMETFIALLLVAVVTRVHVCASERHASDTDTDGIALEREIAKRILMEDNYYAIVSRLDSLTAKVADLEKNQEPSHKTVAFKAHLRKNLTPNQNQLIIFDDVQFNLGQAYHHGIFVAPYNGTYLFSVSMCAHGGHFIIADLMRKGTMIGQVLAGDTVYSACSSETTITELHVGDEIFVQHHASEGDDIQGASDVLNSFTGVLLNVY